VEDLPVEHEEVVEERNGERVCGSSYCFEHYARTR
jgi:hypothetical protein